MRDCALGGLIREFSPRLGELGALSGPAKPGGLYDKMRILPILNQSGLCQILCFPLFQRRWIHHRLGKEGGYYGNIVDDVWWLGFLMGGKTRRRKNNGNWERI